MANPKTKAILEQVRILAQTYPDFVYSTDDHYGNLPCQYNAGGDSEYPELCGCIIGQAARLAGIDTSDWDLRRNRLGIRFQLEDRLGEDTESQSEAKVLIRIQELQDMGVPWGEAYDEATE